MNAIQSNVILTSAATRADGSLGLRFATPELSPEEKTALFELLNRNLKMLLQPVDEAPTGLKDIKGEFDRKTPSQRMRDVLFVLWKHESDCNRCAVPFDAFYLKEMERIITSLKDQLPEQ